MKRRRGRGRHRSTAGSHYRWLLPLTLTVLAGFAWARRFMVDDAFISFRYARNFVEGFGLVWNPGERVEGYTNFLWTLILSLPFRLGVDPVIFCYALGPVLSTLTLYLTSQIALRLVSSRAAALLSVVLLGAHPTFASYATGGLETQLVTCLQTAIVWLLVDRDRNVAPTFERMIAVSLLAALSLLTRLDSAPVVAIACVFAGLDIWKRSASGAMAVRLLAALAAPALLLVGGWLGWKTSYYGELLPNTFYAKAGLGEVWRNGVDYLWEYVRSYLLYPFLVLIPLAVPRLWAVSSYALALLASMLLAHAAYLVTIGGDFMEFRMLVPVLPALLLLIVWAVFVICRRSWLRAAFVLLVLVGSVHHARTFTYTKGGIETIEDMTRHLDHPTFDWTGIGRTLGAQFHDTPDVRIAVSAAGAIPFYSRLAALDMLGLTDAWVARHGFRIEKQAGHLRVAPFSYLVTRQVHLVLGHPWVRSPAPPTRAAYEFQELKRFRYLVDLTPQALPPGASIVEIPLDPTRVVVVLYLGPHPAVDAFIGAGRWRRFPIVPPCQ